VGPVGHHAPSDGGLSVLDALLAALSGGLAAGPLLALAAAAGWGVASMLLSPCHLVSIPLIIGFIGSHDDVSVRRAAGTAFMFAAGILLTIAAIGVATALLGRALGDMGGVVNYVVAIVFFAVGLHLLGVLELPAASAARYTGSRRGPLAALMLGLVFGVALGPCTFAFLAPVVGAGLAVGVERPALAAGLTLAFGVGHCAVIVAAGSSYGWVQGLLDWKGGDRALVIARRATGVLVLLGGLYLIHTA
jgi:cytochrome c-type biogenesis protein